MSNYSIQDESSDHKYFSLIPHIIFEIGLSANQIALYMAIKRSAGEKSQCTRSSKNLANQAGLSKSVLYRTLPSLCEINSILKKPLIKHSSRLTHCGDRDTNLITIIDIWHENFEFIQGGGGVKMTLPSVKSTPGVVSNRHQGSVKMTHKEEHIKKNLYEEEQTPPLPSSKKNGVVGSVVLSVCFFDCLLSVQISDEDKRKLTAMFVESDVIRAVAVLQSQKTVPRNVMGFLISACRKQFAPKENAPNEIILSARAQTNKATIFQFRDTFAHQLSIKDLRITDMLDHLTFGHLKIFYESENFNQDVGKALQHFNLLHLIHKEKPMPIIEEKIICFKNAVQMAHEIINITQRIDDEQL